MRLVAGPAQPELAPPPDYFHLVVDVGHQEVPQVQRAGHTVHEGDGVDRERGLQRRALEQVVQDHQRRGVPLQRDDDPGLALGRLVVHVGYAVDLPGVHQVADLGHDQVRTGLVGQFGDDDPAGPRPLFDIGEGPHPDLPPTVPIGLPDAGPAQDLCSGGEVRARNVLHQVIGCGVRMVDEVDRGVDDLAEVVGRDVGGHAHGDALAAVDQQVREPGRQHLRFGELA